MCLDELTGDKLRRLILEKKLEKIATEKEWEEVDKQTNK